VAGASAYFHVVGLQQRAALRVPIRLKLEDDLLKSEHSAGILAVISGRFKHQIGNWPA
jgi:hypothetical protein